MYLMIGNILFEPARHGPVTRVVPVPPALYRFLPRKSKNLPKMDEKIINSKHYPKRGTNRYKTFKIYVNKAFFNIKILYRLPRAVPGLPRFNEKSTNYDVNRQKNNK